MPAGGGSPRSLTAKIDRSINDFVWAPTARRSIHGRAKRRRADFQSYPGRQVERVRLWRRELLSLSISADGKRLACTGSMMSQPAEVMLIEGQGKARNLSQANAAMLAELDLPKPESVTVKGAGGTPMQMWILKPPGFDPAKKWPLVYLVHGGPQGAWEDAWSYRWNPEVWAAQGYVVALPNPRGSTGFGQQYVDEISGDWGGKCFDDLMAGVAYLEKQPYIDTERMAAAGASFGGYMMNWFEGHTDAVQDADHPLRRLQLRQHVRHDRRTVVRRVGARRAAVGQARVVRETLAASLRPELQDADADHPQRSRFPRAGQRGACSCSPRCSGWACRRR